LVRIDQPSQPSKKHVPKKLKPTNQHKSPTNTKPPQLIKPTPPTRGKKINKALKINNINTSEQVPALELPLFPLGVPNLTKHTELQKSLEDKLKSSQFRYINEQLYTMTGKEAKELFEKNPELPVVVFHPIPCSYC